MKIHTSALSIAVLISAALPVRLHAQTPSAKPVPKKTVAVAADGSGQFKTVQEAVDSAPDGNVRINIKPGEYRALISISTNGVELRGLGKKPEDVVLVYDNSAGTPGTDGKGLGTGKSGTIMLTGDNFYAENLTIANDFEKRHERSNQGSQAVALHVTGDREVFRRVRFLGFQDTLYADSKSCHTPGTDPCIASRQYYADCYVEGHVDFIFGDAKAVFDKCEIKVLPHVMDTITAQSRLRPTEDSGYIFRDCTVTASEIPPGSPQDILLGRPWRAYSTVVFLNTDFKAPLDPAAWKEWNGALATSDYEEYNSHGTAGDVAKRIAPSKQITAADAAKYATKAWMAGSDGWDPEKVR